MCTYFKPFKFLSVFAIAFLFSCSDDSELSRNDDPTRLDAKLQQIDVEIAKLDAMIATGLNNLSKEEIAVLKANFDGADKEKQLALVSSIAGFDDPNDFHNFMRSRISDPLRSVLNDLRENQQLSKEEASKFVVSRLNVKQQSTVSGAKEAPGDPDGLIKCQNQAYYLYNLAIQDCFAKYSKDPNAATHLDMCLSIADIDLLTAKLNCTFKPS